MSRNHRVASFILVVAKDYQRYRRFWVPDAQLRRTLCICSPYPFCAYLGVRFLDQLPERCRQIETVTGQHVTVFRLSLLQKTLPATMDDACCELGSQLSECICSLPRPHAIKNGCESVTWIEKDCILILLCVLFVSNTLIGKDKWGKFGYLLHVHCSSVQCRGINARPF